MSKRSKPAVPVSGNPPPGNPISGNPWSLAGLSAAGLFVVLWSTGFIGAKLGLPHAEPMTFLALRFAIAAVLLGLLALATGAPWPKDWRSVAHLAVAGLLLHGLYLGGVFAGIDQGVEAGVSALIVGIQPVLVAALAGVLLGERVTRRQWLGLVLAVGGVTLVVWRKLGAGLGTVEGVGLCLLALFGITAATLYQKRFCADMDLRSGSVIQYCAAGLGCGVFSLALEDQIIVWHPDFIIAMTWLVLVLSLGAVSLLYWLIKRGAASRVSSLFFLAPPVTALIAWPLFGETLGPTALTGMLLTVVGVALVNLEKS